MVTEHILTTSMVVSTIDFPRHPASVRPNLTKRVNLKIDPSLLPGFLLKVFQSFLSHCSFQVRIGKVVSSIQSSSRLSTHSNNVCSLFSGHYQLFQAVVGTLCRWRCARTKPQHHCGSGRSTSNPFHVFHEWDARWRLQVKIVWRTVVKYLGMAFDRRMCWCKQI